MTASDTTASDTPADDTTASDTTASDTTASDMNAGDTTGNGTNADGGGVVNNGMRPLSPHLVCNGAAAAIDFYREAFGAEEMMRLPDQEGRLMHASISIRGCSVMLVDENLEYGLRSPTSLGGSPVTMHLIVEDVDAAVATAVAAGAAVVSPAEDMFWGDRYGIVRDPFGHEWSIASPVGEPLNLEQLQAAAADAPAM